MKYLWKGGLILLENKNIRVFLIGGNSLIGNAILEGIRLRYKNIKVVKIVRNVNNSEDGLIKVKNYKDSIREIKKIIDDDFENIFILSFGILNEEAIQNNRLENLIKHIEINSYSPIHIFDEIKRLDNLSEVHIVSSILSGFFRPSVGSYSISKYILSKTLQIEIFLDGKIKDKLFVWNPAFVNSKLNEGRSPFILKTSYKNIVKKVSSKTTGGFYYIPSYSYFLVKISSLFQEVLTKIDKKTS